MATPEATAARRLRHWKALFSVFLQDGLAYRAQGLTWILTDVTLAVTMPLVWISAAKGGTIQGFAAGDFVLYYLCVLLLNQFGAEPLHVGCRLSGHVAARTAPVHRRRDVALTELTLPRLRCS